MGFWEEKDMGGWRVEDGRGGEVQGKEGRVGAEGCGQRVVCDYRKGGSGA